MDGELLQTLGKIAGIGGLSLGVLLVVFRDIIRKDIFPKFTNEELGFRLLRYIIFAVLTVALLGMGIWAYGIRARASAPEGTTLIKADVIAGELSLTSIGSIVNRYGEGIPPELLTRIEQALELGSRGKAAQAIPILQSVSDQIDVPALDADLATLYALAGDVDAARARFRTVVQEAPELRQASQNLQTLEKWRETELSAGALELEPNEDLLSANTAPLDVVVSGTLSTPEDVDSYTFTAPGESRDWYVLEIQNRSSVLQPRMSVFNADKSNRVTTADYGFQVTPGQDVSVRLVIEPGSESYVSVSSLGGTGPYGLVFRPEKAYDDFEPNDDILTAREMNESRSWEAGIMDPADVDYFKVHPGVTGPVEVAVENLSAELQPILVVYDADKRHIANTAEYGYQVTAGQNLTLSVDPKSAEIYVEVRSLGGSGPYRVSLGGS